MPGVFLEVSSNDEKVRSKVLLPCGSMLSHLTLLYSKEEIPAKKFREATESERFREKMEKSEIVLEKAIVNTFQAKPGDTRHYVLMMTGAASTKLVWDMQEILRETLGDDKAYDYPVGPHVTHKHCSTVEEAKEVAKELNEKYMPVTVFFKSMLD